MNRDDYRKIKSLSKTEMERWLSLEKNMIYNNLRKQFEEAYKSELDNSIQNFITAIAYTLHYNDDVHLQNDELASFMDDLFVSVDLFRKGEYKPEEYEEQLKEDGIIIEKYDYDKLYKQNREELEKIYKPYAIRNKKAIKHIEDFIANSPEPKVNIKDLQSIIDILEGVL